MPAPNDDVTLPPSAVDSDATLPPPGDPDATLAPDAGARPTSGDARAPAGYAIEQELGRGGMGVVYLARHLGLDRPCALKMILSGAHSGSEEVERFKTEAQAIARLQHPGIVQVFEIGEHDGRPFMALEFCGGGSLDAVLAKNPLPPREAAELVRALAEAMQAAHAANMIHRDLKPANVLLTGDRQPKVTDFGLAKKLDESGATRTGSIMGTPSYMPPEQADGKKDVGPPADIYALGAILYECLTGRPPFRAATPLDTLLQVLTEEPVPLRQLNATVPQDLETIAHKCLQKEPKKRYASAKELANDLGRYLNGEPIQARPVGVVERAVKWVRRNVVVSLAAAVVLLTLTAGVVVSSVYARQAGEEARAARQAEGKADAEATTARKAEAEAKDREKAEAEAKEDAQRQKSRAEDQLRRAEWAVYAGELLLAQSAFAEGNVPDAFRLLDGCQWDLRGWEHRHLRRRFEGSKQTLTGHTHYVLSVAFSPDGKRILTGSWDRTARVWDAAKGTEVLALQGQAAAVTSVAWSPDGNRILTGSGDNFGPGEVKVWEADLGREILSLNGHTQPVRSVCFSPDGKRVLTGSIDKTARVWDADTGKGQAVFKSHTAGITSVAFSPDGKRILTGSQDRTAKVWDAAKGTEILTLGGGPYGVTSVAFSPDGKRILAGREDNSATVWDAEKGTEIFVLKGGEDVVTSVAWSPDGNRILTGYSNQKTAKVWDAEKGTEIFVLKGHTAPVTSVAYSPDGKRILTASQDMTAKVWDADKGNQNLALKGHTHEVMGVAFSPDGKRLLTGSSDSTAKVWDSNKETVIRTIECRNAVICVAWSPDGKRLLTQGSRITIGGLRPLAKAWFCEPSGRLWGEGVGSSPGRPRCLIGPGGSSWLLSNLPSRSWTTSPTCKTRASNARAATTCSTSSP